MDSPTISLVCSTIGRPGPLAALLRSVASSDLAERVEFVLVDQSADQQSTAVLNDYPLQGAKVAATSGRGLSVGRNVGVALAKGTVLAFPDDNCSYPPHTFRQVLDMFDRCPDISGLSGMQVDAAGRPSMLRWLGHPTDITRRNFVRTAISSTLFLRRSALPSAAPFDEGVGVGSPGWRGAGEESDLVLRLLAGGHRMAYRPDIRVCQDDDRAAVSTDYIDKMLKYGVGLGHLWRRHRLSRAQLSYHSTRKLVGSAVRAVRGEHIHARADIAYLRGQLAGYRGVTPSRAPGRRS